MMHEVFFLLRVLFHIASYSALLALLMLVWLAHSDATNRDVTNRDATNRDATNPYATNRDATNRNATNRDATNPNTTNPMPPIKTPQQRIERRWKR